MMRSLRAGHIRVGALVVLLGIGLRGSAQCPGIRPAFAWYSFGTNFWFDNMTDTVGGIEPDSLRWFFGDGASATSTSAAHAYGTSGADVVTLQLWVAGCQFSTTAQVAHGDDTSTCSIFIPADYTSQPIANNEIQFVNGTSASDIALSTEWQFGDASVLLADDAPLHFYLTPGVYAPALSLVGVDSTTLDNCYAGMVRTIAVDGNASTCDTSVFADFTITSFGAAVQVDAEISYFTASLLPYELLWDFGDQGAGVSTVTSAMHDYMYPGDFQVCMELFSTDTIADDSCWVKVCHSVGPPMTFVPDATPPDPLQVFPVPFSDRLQVVDDRLRGSVRVRVIAFAGAQVSEATLPYDEGLVLDLSRLPAGGYILEAQSADLTLRCRVVKQ
jgi:PKD repeat protein